MKKRPLKISTQILTFFFVLAMAGHSHAQVFERTKSISRSFPVTKQCLVKLTNKYGDVMVNTWEKDSVAITVTIRSTDKKETDAANKLSSIDAQFTANPYYIDVQTVFKDNKTALNATISEFTSGIFNSKRRVTIDYAVTIPEWTSLEINNKYGNVFTTRHTGNFTLNLSNGDFKGAELLGESNVSVNFGNITLNTIKSGKLDISYSEMTLKQGGGIKLESRSSKFWFTSIQTMDINSKRDKFNIDTLTSLTGQCDFSTLQLNLLDNTMTLKTNYGDLKTNQLGNMFKNISLTSQYTDIVIGIPSQISLTLTAEYKKTIVTLPALFKDIKPQLVDEKNQQYKLNGQFGTNMISPAGIQLNAISGSIVFIVN
jgi:hypothetical protein